MEPYRINLSVRNKEAQKTDMKLCSGDYGVLLDIRIKDYDTTGTTAEIVFHKADGNVVEAPLTGSNGVYTYEILGNEISYPGTVVADVKLKKTGSRDSTAKFIFSVDSDTLNDTPIASGAYSARLDDVINEALGILDTVRTADQNEPVRITAEQARVSAESTRVSSEQARIAAENQRATLYGQYDTKLDDIQGQFNDALINEQDTRKQAVVYHKNLLETEERTVSTLWNRNTLVAESSAICLSFKPIRIIQGTTYYIKNVWAYFGGIKYDDNTIVNITEDSANAYSGSFTPSKSGYVYLTIDSRSYTTSCIFTTDQEMYTNAKYASYYSVGNALAPYTSMITALNGIVTSGVPLDVISNLDTIGGVVIGDGKFAIHKYNTGATSAPDVSGYLYTWKIGTDNIIQLVISLSCKMYIRGRRGSTTWSSWARMADMSDITNAIDAAVPKIITVKKDGSGNYTSLVAAINYATQYMDSTVYVGAGAWDVIAELGDTYINAVSAATTQRGIILKNRIRLIFAPNSKVLCNYTGSRVLTMQWLSAFNAGIHGFTLENAIIECSNVRYCVHDERDSDTDFYVNKYINCSMHLNNIGNSNIRSCNPIGGGLGLNGYVVIDGGVYEGEATEVYTDYLPLVTYHNSAGANGRNHISVRNCYLKGNKHPRFRFNWYGQSTDITNVEVSGCSMGASILSQAETSDGTSPYVNMAVTEWNNTVRA